MTPFPARRNNEHTLLSDDTVGRHTRFKCIEGFSFQYYYAAIFAVVGCGTVAREKRATL